MGFSMFDWPEPSQTSPTRMLVNTFVSPDSMTRDRGREEAFNLPSFTSHRPSAAARVDLLWPANVTVTLAPGAAQPQTGTGICRCNTMLSPKMAGIFSSARAEICAAKSTPASAKLRRKGFIIMEFS